VRVDARQGMPDKGVMDEWRPLVDAGAKDEILGRLKIVQGHMRGIAHMVEEDRHPLEVIRQTCAVRRAIDRINGLLLEHHLKRCLSRTLCEGDPETRRQAVEEVLALLQLSARR